MSAPTVDIFYRCHRDDFGAIRSYHEKRGWPEPRLEHDPTNRWLEAPAIQPRSPKP